MDPVVILVVALGLLLLLLAAKLPVAFALLATGVAGIVLLDGLSAANSTLARLPYQIPSRYVLVIIPFFIAMGLFAKHGTLAVDAFTLASRLTRRIPGGLAIATVTACAGFAAVSGSSVATIAALGSTAIREMRRHGYDLTLAAGVVGASGTLGVLIPPSIALVLYGIVTNVSIGHLLIGGVLPGILTALVYALGIAAACWLRPTLSGAVRASATDEPLAEPDPAAANDLGVKWTAMLRIALLFGTVVGGIYSGILTSTEAGAIGAVTALVMLVYDSFRRGSLREAWTDTSESIMETVSLTSMTFMLLIGSAVFTYFLVSAGIPSAFTAWVLEQPAAPMVVVALLLLAFVPLGMFLDPISMLLIGVPLAFPVITQLGFDGVWFGILVVKMMEIGLITPPFGLNAYIVSGVADDISVERAFAGVLWFLPLDVVVILLIFFIPEIVTWLPAQMN